jgi:hypothetical protein
MNKDGVNPSIEKKDNRPEAFSGDPERVNQLCPHMKYGDS